MGFWLLLALTSRIGVDPDQAEQAMVALSWRKTNSLSLAAVIRDKGYGMQTVTLGLLRIWYRLWGTGEIQLRILGWAVWVGIVWWISKLDTDPVVKLLAAASPWAGYLAFFRLEILVTILGALFWMFENRRGVKYAGWLVMTGSSLPGLIAGGVGWFWELRNRRNKRIWLVMGALVLILIVQSNIPFLKKTSEPTLITQLTPGRLAGEVDLSQKNLFLAANQQFILPTNIRRFLYNKLTQGVKQVESKIVGIFDFELWTAPLTAWVLTGLSGIPPRGYLPLLYVWEIPLLIWAGIKYRRKLWLGKMGTLIIAAIIGAVIFEKKLFGTNSALAWPAVILTLTAAVSSIPIRIVKWSLVMVYGIGIWQMGQLFFHQSLNWRRSDAYVYKIMYEWVAENHTAHSEVIVTDRFGPSPLLFTFYGKWNPVEYWARRDQNSPWYFANVGFKGFDLTKDNIPDKSAWLGLPGEFSGPSENIFNSTPLETTGKLIKIETGEALVSRYGQGIWIWEKRQN